MAFGLYAFLAWAFTREKRVPKPVGPTPAEMLRLGVCPNCGDRSHPKPDFAGSIYLTCPTCQFMFERRKALEDSARAREAYAAAAEEEKNAEVRAIIDEKLN